jgi:uncharacterized protein (TIGR03437 family)
MRYFSLSICLFATLVTCSAQNSAWYIDTIAGKDRPIQDGGAGTNAVLNGPSGVIVDTAGNVIFADSNNHRIRRVAPDGTISTIVGTGIAGYSGDVGPALQAQLITPKGLALDQSGNLYIADFGANVIRKMTTDGYISSVAGTGLPGSAGDGGLAISAALNGPSAVTIDGDGNLIIADAYNNAIRKVKPDGTISRVTTVPTPEGVAVDAAGNLYISAWGQDEIVKVSASGTVSVAAGSTGTGFSGDAAQAATAMLSGPRGIAVDSFGNIWFSDSRNNRIRRIGADGIMRTVIGSGTPGYNAFGTDPMALSVDSPDGLFVDGRGNVYWSEAGNQRIRKYNQPSNLFTELAGSTLSLTSSGVPTSLSLLYPSTAVTDSAGNLYIADTSNNVIRKITSSGASSVVAGTGVDGFNGDIGVATALQLNNPQGVAVDSKGNLLIADTGNYRIRQVNASGVMTTIMGNGNYLPLTGTLASAAALISPTAVVANPAGGFYVVDQLFQVVLSVDPGASITLFSGANVGYFSFPTSLAVGANGTFYIADTFNNRIVKYQGSGVFSVVAGSGTPGFQGDGGSAAKARLFLPYAIAVDSNNNLFIADSGNNRIRMVDNSGVISTIAGNGQLGFSGDTGPAANAQMAIPSSLNIDGAGNIEFADTLNQRIRILRYQQVVADLAMRVDSVRKDVLPGNILTVRLSLTSTSGTGPVAIAVSGAPAGVAFQFSPSASVTVAAGQTAVVTATAQIPASFAPGTSTLTFSASSGSGASILQRTATVSLNITNAPQFIAGGVVSAASFAGGGVSPGEIITVFGQAMGPAALVSGTLDSNNLLPKILSGTRVLFDGAAAPILYLTAGQLAAIVPYAVAGKPATQMQIEFNGQQSTAVSLNVVDAAPALFNAGASSQAAALNQDFSVNSASNPAKAGSEIVLFGTGEGLTAPASIDGKLATDVFPAPLAKITVTIGGEPAVVDYAAAAPYEVAGVFQINARIPADLPTGSASVVVTAGTRVSTGTSTIAVQ